MQMEFVRKMPLPQELLRDYPQAETAVFIIKFSSLRKGVLEKSERIYQEKLSWL